jgi:hypothetical protein
MFHNPYSNSSSFDVQQGIMFYNSSSIVVVALL